MMNLATVMWAYGTVGVMVLTGMLIQHMKSWRKESPWVRETMDLLHPERRTLRYRILGRVVAPALAGLAVIVIWPVALVMLILQIYRDRRELQDRKAFNALESEDAHLTIKREHLLEELTLTEIELRERVVDPLAAAPDLPFGHLNPLWESFVRKLQPSDRIWSFELQGETDWGAEELRKGYVAVRGNTIIESLTIEKISSTI